MSSPKPVVALVYLVSYGMRGLTSALKTIFRKLYCISGCAAPFMQGKSFFPYVYLGRALGYAYTLYKPTLLDIPRPTNTMRHNVMPCKDSAFKCMHNAACIFSVK